MPADSPSTFALPEPASDKEARFQAVADAVVRRLLRGGPNDLKYAAIARSAGVSRAWIYKYFGAEVDDLLDYVVRAFGDAFAELEVEREGDWRERMETGTRKGLRDVAAAPWLMTIHGRYRHSDNRLGVGLRDLLQRFVGSMVQNMPAPLRRDRDRATRFAEAFMAARIGMFVEWSDPAVRARLDEDEVVDDLLAMVDRYIASVRA